LGKSGDKGKIQKESSTRKRAAGGHQRNPAALAAEDCVQWIDRSFQDGPVNTPTGSSRRRRRAGGALQPHRHRVNCWCTTGKRHGARIGLRRPLNVRTLRPERPRHARLGHVAAPRRGPSGGTYRALPPAVTIQSIGLRTTNGRLLFTNPATSSGLQRRGNCTAQ
jgi:hypothetical protein